MLLPYCEPEISIEDRKLFDTLVPFDHWTRRADKHIDFLELRKYGLVKDRLRLKDATHVLADIAIPAGLQLVAQARNKLLTAAEPFDTERVAGERIQIDTIRRTTEGSGVEARLLARVGHLRDILAWVEQLAEPVDADDNPTWKSLQTAVDVARKVLAGNDAPDVPGKIRSTVDRDARRGKDGDFYDGYMVGVPATGARPECSSSRFSAR